MLTYIFAALAIVGGIIAFVWSLTVGMMTGVQMAILAVALFAFAGALGIWRIAGMVEDFIEAANKPPPKPGEAPLWKLPGDNR